MSNAYDMEAMCACGARFELHKADGDNCPDNNGGWLNSVFRPAVADDDLGSVVVPVSLRDWFAGQALAGICASAACSAANPTFDDVARKSYAQADAMLKERGGGK